MKKNDLLGNNERRKKIEICLHSIGCSCELMFKDLSELGNLFLDKRGTDEQALLDMLLALKNIRNYLGELSSNFSVMENLVQELCQKQIKAKNKSGRKKK